jgi:chromosome segregation ATPase
MSEVSARWVLLLQVEAQRLREAISLSEAIKANAEERIEVLQEQVATLKESVGRASSANEQLESATWQLAQERVIKADLEEDLQHAQEQLRILLQDAESQRGCVRSVQSDLAAVTQRESTQAVALKSALENASESSRAAEELRSELDRVRKHEGELTGQLTESVSTLEQLRGVLAKGETRQAELQDELAVAYREVATAAARALQAQEALDVERDLTPEKEELIRDLAEQVCLGSGLQLCVIVLRSSDIFLGQEGTKLRWTANS